MKLAPFVYKEMLHVLRDKRMLFVALAIPIVQMLLFGFAISTEVNNINVAVAYDRYDEDVRQAIERISSNPYVTLKGRLTTLRFIPHCSVERRMPSLCSAMAVMCRLWLMPPIPT